MILNVQRAKNSTKNIRKSLFFNSHIRKRRRPWSVTLDPMSWFRSKTDTPFREFWKRCWSWCFQNWKEESSIWRIAFEQSFHFIIKRQGFDKKIDHSWRWSWLCLFCFPFSALGSWEKKIKFDNVPAMRWTNAGNPCMRIWSPVLMLVRWVDITLTF